MSRRVVIAILALLILGIVGGTIALVANRLQGTPEADEEQSPDGTLAPAESGTPTVVNPSEDDDGDGLTNAEEAIWGTNASIADTDGDGFIDGEEVRANHNPTIAGPNDTLPENFDPARDLRPLDVAPDVAQYFAPNLDLSGPKENLTEKYEQTVPEDNRNATSLATFVETQPIITQLPLVNEEFIQQTVTTDALSLGQYLVVVGDLEPISDKGALDRALLKVVTSGNTQGFQALALQVRLYQDDLLQASVPQSAVSLQKLLLGYTELLASTFDQIAIAWGDDPVKGMLAMRQLETIDKQYYPVILAELERLTALAAP